MKKQKYKKYDHVKVIKDLGGAMNHFTSDCEAIIIGSYKDQFGGSNIDDYTIYIKGEDETSWYETKQLTFISHNRKDLLQEWKKELKRQEKIDGNLERIFNNGNKILNGKTIPNATIETLAECIGVNLWGSNGEGITYYNNIIMVMRHAEPFLMAENKKAWLAYCELFKEN